jgi:hypothetical protein
MAGLVSELLKLAAEDNLTVLEVLHRLCDEERAGRRRTIWVGDVSSRG